MRPGGRVLRGPSRRLVLVVVMLSLTPATSEECHGRQVVWDASGSELLGSCMNAAWLCGKGCGVFVQGHDGVPSRYQWHAEDCSCAVPSFAEAVAAFTSPPTAPPSPTL